jgi:hypothetical protein
VGVLQRVAGERDVVLVHVDRHAELAAGALGEADVVEMGMGQHERGDVGHAAAEDSQRVVQRVP